VVVILDSQTLSSLLAESQGSLISFLNTNFIVEFLDILTHELKGSEPQ